MPSSSPWFKTQRREISESRITERLGKLDNILKGDIAVRVFLLRRQQQTVIERIFKGICQADYGNLAHISV